MFLQPRGRLNRKTRLGLQVLKRNVDVVGEGLLSLDGHVRSRLSGGEGQGMRVEASESELRVVELMVSDGG